MTVVSTAWDVPATGDALCPRGLFQEDDYRTLRRHTDVIVGEITNPVVRDAVEAYNWLLNPHVPDAGRCFPLANTQPSQGKWYADLDWLTRNLLTVWTPCEALEERSDPASPQLAVEAVSYIQQTLGLSLKQTLKAALIKPRTYHSWQEHPDRQPRITSQGRLWRLHQLAEDLDETMGVVGVRRWLSGDGSRLAALLSGRFDDVAVAAYPAPGRQEQPVQNFDAALDERENKLRMPRYPVTGLRMNRGDVAGPRK